MLCGTNPFSFSIRRGYWAEGLLTPNWNFLLESIGWNETECKMDFLCNFVSHCYLLFKIKFNSVLSNNCMAHSQHFEKRCIALDNIASPKLVMFFHLLFFFSYYIPSWTYIYRYLLISLAQSVYNILKDTVPINYLNNMTLNKSTSMLVNA